jgi:Tfp pilus assembly protein PilO
MNAIFDRLDGKERKTLERLAAAVCAAMILFLILATRQRTSYFEAEDALKSTRDNTRRIEKMRDETKAEWLRWQEAARDLESFRGTYFYDEKTVIQKLRLDLRQIFSQAGMDVPQLQYRYSDLEKVDIKKVVVTFSYSGTYVELKRFLAIVERFPKFLAVEKIDFQKTDAASGLLNLKLTLAGYYEP